MSAFQIGDIVELRRRFGKWVVVGSDTSGLLWRVTQHKGFNGGPPEDRTAGASEMTLLARPILTSGMTLFLREAHRVTLLCDDGEDVQLVDGEKTITMNRGHVIAINVRELMTQQGGL